MRMRRKKLTLAVLSITLLYFYTRKKTGGRENSFKDVCDHPLNISSPRIVYPGSKDVLCQKSCAFRAKTKSSHHCKECSKKQFCNIKWTGQLRSEVVCSKDPECSSGFQLGILDETWKKVNWEDFSSHSSLRLYISSLIENSNKKDIPGFLFIRCSEGSVEIDSSATQILALPPRKLDRSPTKLLKDRVSVNIIALGSMSRDDMFANYPQTIWRLNQVNRDHLTQTEILDFKMTQSLGSDDVHNLRALLTGYVDQMEDEQGSKAEHIFGLFKSKGYQTLAYESGGCWFNNSKLASIILNHNNKNNNNNLTRQIFEEHLELAGVGAKMSTTLASCFLSPSSPSSSSSSTSCCTSIQQFEVNMLSLWMQLSNLEHHKMPAFSLLVAEDSPPDNKFDELLLGFVEKSLGLKNTITIITAVQSSSAEAGLPLFLVVPGRVKSLLQDKEWQSLVLNQDRLVSLLDIHTTLRYFLKSKPSETLAVQDSMDEKLKKFRAKFVPNEAGLLKEVSSLRHCDNMARAEFGCLCRPDAAQLSIDNKIKLLGLFGCEMFQGGSLCGCTTLSVVSATKLTNPGEDTFENLVALEMENGQGIRTLLQINLNKNNRRIKVSSIASNLDCASDLSKEDDILDHIDDKIVEPGVRKTVESLYTEGGLECLFLVELSVPGVSTVQLVNTCPSEVELKLEFRTETAFYLHLGEHVSRVGAGRLDPVNVFIEQNGGQPVWEYSLLEAESM